MEVGAKRRRAEEDEEEERVDHISRLPDAVLGEIISLLPTKDGARTQVISRRWRPLWRSAPLNLDLHGMSRRHGYSVHDISGILAAHPGPGRRFSILTGCLKRCDRPAAILDGWLRSRALDNLQELEFHFHYGGLSGPPPLPASAHRFSDSLRVASFGYCRFPDGNDAGVPQLPLLKQLSLSIVVISENSLYALLAGCPDLHSLLLYENQGFSRVRIVSRTLRSMGVKTVTELKLVIEDAPCLERLLLFEHRYRVKIDVTVNSASKLDVLGLFNDSSRLELGTTVFQGLRLVNLTTVVQSVKVLSLLQDNLSLDVVINFMKCFPCLEKLYIKTHAVGKKNAWCHKYRGRICSLDVRLKKIVLTNYRGNHSHVNFAKFFVLNARVLESMRLELESGNPNIDWIERQHRLLRIKNRASRGAQFDFVSRNSSSCLCLPCPKLVHDLSTADPFVRFHNWV
ncbi:hypothetical protein ACP70R_015152 [Stipagrostis hirtigluma subsp. patula]